MIWKNMLAQRWLRLAFLCSLASNFFLIALGVSLYLERPTAFPPEPDAFMERMAGQLSSEGEAVFRRTFEKHRAEIAARRDAMANAHAEIRRLASTEPLDLEAMQRLRETRPPLMEDFMNSIDNFMIEVLPQLSAEDRRRLANATPG